MDKIKNDIGKHRLGDRNKKIGDANKAFETFHNKTNRNI